jgi:3-oxoacyl-[acyl-carrier protein] reductase
MDLNLTDKVFMVAASSKGLGRAIAHALAREGAQVSMASRTQTDIEEAASSIATDCSTTTRAYVLDASSAESISQWTDQTLKDFGRIDGLVVNAGGPPQGMFDSLTDSDWEGAFELTLMSAVRMIRAVLPTMKRQNSGSILTLTSSSIREPIDVLVLSNVFRSGTLSLVKSLSIDLASHGIRINNLVPGQIDTDRMQSNDEFTAARKNIPVEELRAARHKAIPLGRYGQPDEFASAAAFLLSDAASYITGTSLIVDGGKLKGVV